MEQTFKIGDIFYALEDNIDYAGVSKGDKLEIVENPIYGSYHTYYKNLTTGSNSSWGINKKNYHLLSREPVKEEIKDINKYIFYSEELTNGTSNINKFYNKFYEQMLNYGTAFIYEPEQEALNNNKTMSNIKNFFNDLTVSSEDKELKKAGLKDSNLNWTNDSRSIILDLAAEERGYKNYDEMIQKVGISIMSALEYDNLFAAYYDKLLSTAKKFNKKQDKK